MWTPVLVSFVGAIHESPLSGGSRTARGCDTDGRHRALGDSLFLIDCRHDPQWAPHAAPLPFRPGQRNMREEDEQQAHAAPMGALTTFPDTHRVGLLPWLSSGASEG